MTSPLYARFLTTLPAALLLALAPVSEAEERISNPSLGPMGGFTSEVRVAERASDDVAVWFSAGKVWASIIDDEGRPSVAIPIANVTENRVPDLIAVGDEAFVFWADRGDLFQRRLTKGGETPDSSRLIWSGVNTVSVARSREITAVLCDPYLVGATYVGSVLHLLDESDSVERRVLVWQEEGGRLAAWNGGFVSAVRSSAGVKMRRLSSAGELLDSLPVLATGPSWSWDFAAHGNRAWVASMSTQNLQAIQIAALAPDGTLVVNTSISLVQFQSTIIDFRIAAGPNGAVLLLALDDDIYRLRLANDGSELEPLTRVVQRPGRQWVRAVSSGHNQLEFWSDVERTDVLVQVAGSETARFMTVAGTRATGQAIAAAPDSMLSVWREVAGDSDIYRYRLLDGAGKPIGEPIEFDRGGGSNFAPTVAWSGTEFGILWHANQRTQLLRLGANGSARGGAVALATVPAAARLFGGHSVLVALWASALGADEISIRASIVGASGAGTEMTLTTPLPPPPNAGSRDGNAFIVPLFNGWQLVYENTIYYFCTGIPCPFDTSVITSSRSRDLSSDGTAPLVVERDATIVALAANGQSSAILARGIDLTLHTLKAGDTTTTATRLWQQTAWRPFLRTADVAPRIGGFAVALAEYTDDDRWVSIRELSIDGREVGSHVLEQEQPVEARLAHSATGDVIFYSRVVPGENGGVSLFTQEWRDAPIGPQAPAIPTNVVVRLLASQQVEVRWEYDGPPVRGFAIGAGTYDNPDIVDASARSVILSRPRAQYRVVAFNEAGSSASEFVQPAHGRRRSIRR